MLCNRLFPRYVGSDVDKMYTQPLSSDDGAGGLPDMHERVIASELAFCSKLQAI